MTELVPDPRSVETAAVYKSGQLAAHLRRIPGGVTFAYTDEWIAGGGAPVAHALPVTPVPVTRPGGALPAYFSGLLPEGRRLGALRRQVKTSADDELSLLLAVGADAIGDVQVLPEGVEPGEVTPRVVVDDISTLRFSHILDDLGIRPDVSAIPGVQDKVSARMLNVPVASQSARYILKLTPPEFPHLVANEQCMLTAAALAGLTTVEHRVITDSDGADGLLVTRFDRISSSGGALAAEDGCQVADLPPADKYRMTTEQVCQVLSRQCQAPLIAARNLLTQHVFAYLTGNGDAHAKNFAILQHPDGEWKVSPAYDLPTSQVYDDNTTALSVNGRRSDLGARDFLALGAALELPERAVTRILTNQTDRVDAWLSLVDDLPFDKGRISKLRRVIAHRRKRLTPT